MTETSFGHGGAVLLWQITMFLAAVVAVLLAANRLRLDSTIGYLVLGVLLDPAGVGLIDSPETLRLLGEFGIAFLLFTIGLELSFDRLQAMWRDILDLGFLQVAITAGVLYVIMRLAGLAPQESFLIGASMSLSSTAVVVDVLRRRREDGTPVGRTS